MAKKKEETQETAASEMAAQVDAENMENTVDTENTENNAAAQDDAVSGAAVEKTEDSTAEGGKPGADDTPDNPDASETQEEIVEKPKLENLSVLADRHRIPAWQQAALLRYMGWQDDKLVSDEDYMAAMQALKTRRIGGGRR